MALAGAYGKAERRSDEEYMLRCAYQQGHGPAAYELALWAEIQGRNQDAIRLYQDGAKFGSYDCAVSLHLLFGEGNWAGAGDKQQQALREIGVQKDAEREHRYAAITDALEINPDMKLGRLDQVLPLPPAELPKWRGIEDAIDPEPSGPPTY